MGVCCREYMLITCSSSVDESCRLEPADSDERNLGGGFGGTLPEKHSDICMQGEDMEGFTEFPELEDDDKFGVF